MIDFSRFYWARELKRRYVRSKYNFQTLLWFLVDSFVILQPRLVAPKTLLIIRLDGIGDYVLFRTFFREIKRSHRFSDYSITLCANEVYRDLAIAIDREWIGKFIWLNKHAFRYNWIYRFAKLRMIRKRGFEVVLNPIVSRETIYGDPIVRISGAAEKVGNVGDLVNASRWECAIYDRYYTRLINSSESSHFEFYKNREFVEKVLTAPVQIEKPSLPRLSLAEENLQYAVISPGATQRVRKWSIGKFLEVADHLFLEHKLASFLVGSPGDLQPEEVSRSLANRPYVTNTIGTLSLVETTSVIQCAKILITNDTGLAHIGAASGIPVVAISNGNHFGRFTEYPKSISPSVLYAYPDEISHSNLSFVDLITKFKYGSQLKIDEIKVDLVIRLTEALLKPELSKRQ